MWEGCCIKLIIPEKAGGAAISYQLPAFSFQAFGDQLSAAGFQRSALRAAAREERLLEEMRGE